MDQRIITGTNLLSPVHQIKMEASLDQTQITVMTTVQQLVMMAKTSSISTTSLPRLMTTPNIPKGDPLSEKRTPLLMEASSTPLQSTPTSVNSTKNQPIPTQKAQHTTKTLLECKKKTIILNAGISLLQSLKLELMSAMYQRS